MQVLGIIRTKCTPESFEKLLAVKSPEVVDFVVKYVELCNPDKVFVRSDCEEDASYIRKKAIELGEEKPLKIKGHTVHFDGIFDQARDKGNTKFLVTPEINLEGLNCINREEGLEEMMTLLKDSMKGKEMYVLFLCLGPVNSEFSIYALQLTDSAYVAHSEDILYRPAYEIFRNNPDIKFFKYVHSAGELDDRKNSKNIDKRRIYVDFLENTVYSVNTQYAGNTVGLKKPSLRLAIRKASKEGWLAEHMFLMGVKGLEEGEPKIYFTGAFPSGCGKTSTCMVEGESIVGDDIAYLRKKDGKVYAVNVERGIFGIIRDVNPVDDPLIWEMLNKEGEVIFSNVLIKDGIPYWQGDGRISPTQGENFSGKWYVGKVDKFGNEIPFAHPNARYTMRLKPLKNVDPELENPQGVEVGGIIYGGRDSDTWPAVFESFDWEQGVITIGAALESETTAATLDRVGERKFNLMANLDFLSIPVGEYIQNHLNFISGLKKTPRIFGVNYFLKDENGRYLTGMHDKRVWLKWMWLRVNNRVDAITAPIGYLPYYQDLRELFSQLLSKNFSEDDYIKIFSIRVSHNLEKIQRIFNIYKGFKNIPDRVFEVLQQQAQRLKSARDKFGDIIPPHKFL
ncbi:MAG: phosphoenolpyruvate carboxykinase (GTP) [Candidatus Omnitrophica bacterium]|nr:phosphoenolpyruvate carboxykinase (GTP) [Candidatus Omnitrophota bacterium]